MTVEDIVLEKLKTLPDDKKQEVLDFAEFLVQKESRGNFVDEAIDDVFENRRDLLERLAEGAK
jgi:hypothetical protein